MDIRDVNLCANEIKFPSESYRKNILEELFVVQKDYTHSNFMTITKAHIVMLLEQEIITEEEAVKMLKGVLKVDEIDISTLQYDTRFEDLFFLSEMKLKEEMGIDLAGKIHIARSRNDLHAGEFRMALHEKVTALMGEMNELRCVIMDFASKHTDTISPAYTHTQPAQPTTIAHYFMAYYDNLCRDFERISLDEKNINRSPLGAVAITTTGFPISRERMCELLGFYELVENSYDAIAGVDYFTSLAGNLMVLNTNFSKFLKDILDYVTKEFNVLYVSDPFVQISSIMPQKRNPSALEHLRPLVSRAIADANSVFTVQHNTPFGDIVDNEEQLQPYLHASIEETISAFDLFKNILYKIKVNKDVLEDRIKNGYISVTELADSLVRVNKMSFRESHHIVQSIVKELAEKKVSINNMSDEELSVLVEKVNKKNNLSITVAFVRTTLDPINFVKVRDRTGGINSKIVSDMISKRKLELDKDFELVNSILEMKNEAINSLNIIVNDIIK